MCECFGDDDPQPIARPASGEPLPRRRFGQLAVGGAIAVAAAVGLARPQRALAIEVAPGLTIQPRDAWGADLPPKWAMPSEEVRFLLIHHTASSNSITDARSVIRQAYAFHTGPSKRWPDVAYNFFVGADGSVWEGRAGSLDGPVRADATGGNQGFSQLICLIGNFVGAAPTAAAQASLVRLLGYLAVRDDLSTWAGASTTFISRGSNRHRAGTQITTSTISGHRDMSYTACPGDVAYGLLPEWRRQAHAVAADTWQRDGTQRAERLRLRAP